VSGDYANDDAILLGTLLREAGDASNAMLEQAALLAAEEINTAAAGGGLPKTSGDGGPRPLVVIGCDTSADARRPARHLVETLHVPAIVGPTSGEDVVDISQQISSKAGTLIMTPTSLASTISQLDDDDLTWRDVPSDAQRAKLVIEQMGELETVLRATRGLTSVKLGVVYRTDALGQSARESIAGKLIINGHFINDPQNAANVSLDPYEAADSSSQSGIATKYATTFRPDIVFLTAPEQIANVMVPLEQALTAARIVNHPYYVCTEAMKTQELLDATTSNGMPADIGRRIRGIGVKPDASSSPVLAGFDAAFTARYGQAPTAAAAATYDAMYAIAYAIAATADMPLGGASVAHGLRALGVGTAYTVGATDVRQVVESLSAGTSVSLRGTYGPMQWDPRGDIAGGTVEVWCVGTTTRPAKFGNSGLTMDVGTQVVGGAFVQCQ
jgi:branched-chain amino acid transport system substrate-binding protein